MITPYPDQIQFVNAIVRKLSDGYKRVCCQLATGGGKTVCFSYLIQRYLIRNPSAKICILVHRTELQAQTKKTLSAFNIHNVDVEMVETFNNKLKKRPTIHYDLLIADECHLANFFKVITHYKASDKTIILGFSATPKAASKKTPLNGYFQTIVVGTEINKLIAMQRLCPAIHHAPDVEIGKIAMSGGDYNLAALGVEFSKPKLVEGVLDAYKKYCDGKKTLIFNTTIEHSNLVHEYFKTDGFNSRSLDSKSVTDDVRKETFEWLKSTDGAILNNVGIATTGFDDPSIEAIIFNRKTKSLPLWLQCCGRGARINPLGNKDYFIIIDLGDNIEGEGFGHWNERHDWEQIFYNPSRSAEGVAPMKKCPECDARIYMSSTECRWCGHLMPRATVYTDMVLSLRILPDGPVKKNSQTQLYKLIDAITDRVKQLKITTNEKKELMFYSFKEAHEKAGFEPKPHILSHLVSIYGK